MPELLNKSAIVDNKVQAEPEEFAHGMESAPTEAIDTIQVLAPEKEFVLDFLHFAKKLDDIADRIGELVEVTQSLVNDNIKSRTFVDRSYNVSKSVGYVVEYLERKYLFARCNVALTLVLPDGTTRVINNTWTSINLQRGLSLYAQGVSNNTPIVLQVRACDENMSGL